MSSPPSIFRSATDSTMGSSAAGGGSPASQDSTPAAHAAASDSQHRRTDTAGTHGTIDMGNLSFDHDVHLGIALGSELGLEDLTSGSGGGTPGHRRDRSRAELLPGGSSSRPASAASRGRTTSAGSMTGNMAADAAAAAASSISSSLHGSMKKSCSNKNFAQQHAKGTQPMKVASSEPMSAHDDSVRHSGFLVRLMHCRRTQCKVGLALLCVIGLAVGLTFGLCQDGESASPAAGQGSSNNDSGSGTNHDEEKHGYYPDPDQPPQDVPTAQGAAAGTPTESWGLGMHLEGDMTDAMPGSTLSFSSDSTRLAISSQNSDTVQVLKVNKNGVWSQLGEELPGRVAAMSGDGTRIVVADSALSSVVTYELIKSEWTQFGSTLTDLWGAKSVSFDADGSTLAVSHYPDPICRICPSVATVYALNGSEEGWVQSSDILGAYDFDFSVSLSSDGQTLGFSGRVYESQGEGNGWDVKADFPDFISGLTALSSNGNTAAISLPDCHVFKGADPTATSCTNEETYEVSVMEFEPQDNSNGGWWNRKGISIGPEIASHLGSTGISLSEDGNTVAIAVGTRGEGGELPVGDPLEDDPMDDDIGGLRRRRLTQEEGEGRRQAPKAIVHRARQEQGVTDEDFMDFNPYEYAAAYVRVYRYNPESGDWSVVGDDIDLDASGSTVALSSDGTRMAVGVPYGGEMGLGYVKIYDLVTE